MGNHLVASQSFTTGKFCRKFHRELAVVLDYKRSEAISSKRRKRKEEEKPNM